MHKRAFQGLKRTFMHVSGLTPPYFDLKKQFIMFMYVSGLTPTNSDLKKPSNL